MPDAPDGFSKRDLAKPPGKRELAKADREWKALAIWQKTTDLRAVRDQMKLPSVRQAQILVNRGVARWHEDSVIFADQEYARNAMIARDVITKLQEAVLAGDLRLTNELKNMMDRQSKLLGLDKQREQTQQMPNITVITGIPEITPAPSRTERPALPEPDTIDGEVVE